MIRRHQSLMGATALVAILGTMLASGCATAPPQPLTEIALARTAITQAEQAGASQAAPVELSAAREHLAEAEHLSGQDPERARWRARESESDARLAEARAHDAKARLAVAALDRNVDTIRATP